MGRGAWCVVRDACSIVSANATFRVRSLMRRGFDRDPNQMGLASSIGIGWKGTRPPLKTDSPNTLSSTFGGTLAEPWLFGHVLTVKAPNPPLCPIQPEAICYHVVTI